MILPEESAVPVQGVLVQLVRRLEVTEQAKVGAVAVGRHQGLLVRLAEFRSQQGKAFLVEPACRPDLPQRPQRVGEVVASLERLPVVGAQLIAPALAHPLREVTAALVVSPAVQIAHLMHQELPNLRGLALDKARGYGVALQFAVTIPLTGVVRLAGIRDRQQLMHRTASDRTDFRIEALADDSLDKSMHLQAIADRIDSCQSQASELPDRAAPLDRVPGGSAHRHLERVAEVFALSLHDAHQAIAGIDKLVAS